MADDSNVFAALAHGLGLILMVIPALVIWLIKKDDDAFIDSQCKQAMNFQITMFIASMVAALLTIVLIGLILLPVIGILFIVFTIIAIIKSAGGDDYAYPRWCTIQFLK